MDFIAFHTNWAIIVLLLQWILCLCKNEIIGTSYIEHIMYIKTHSHVLYSQETHSVPRHMKHYVLFIYAAGSKVINFSLSNTEPIFTKFISFIP